MFWSKNKKNLYTCKPQSYYTKAGCKGVFVTRTCFRDGFSVKTSKQVVGSFFFRFLEYIVPCMTINANISTFENAFISSIGFLYDQVRYLVCLNRTSSTYGWLLQIKLNCKFKLHYRERLHPEGEHFYSREILLYIALACLRYVPKCFEPPQKLWARLCPFNRNN